VQSIQQRLLGSARQRQCIDPTQHADATSRTTTSSTPNRSVWNAGVAAGIEHSIADWHANNAAARISYADEATATLKQPARPPCDTNERQERTINPVKLDLEIPARPTHIGTRI
jgi:hypothetical protein